MKKIVFLVLLLNSTQLFSQSKNFIDQPYLETVAIADTLVTPDRIYLSILISEKDTKGKISVEELESQMIEKIKSIGITTDKQLFVSDVASNFKKYFIKPQDILKSKSYTLLVYDAQTAGAVILELENLGISNVDLDRTEYSKIDALKLELRTRAVQKAKTQATAMIAPLNQKLGPAIFVSDMDHPMVAKVSGMQVMRASSKANIPSIEFEKIKVKSEISIKFKIE